MENKIKLRKMNYKWQEEQRKKQKRKRRWRMKMNDELSLRWELGKKEKEK